MENFTNIKSLISALAVSMNLINRDMQHHHEQVAYLAFQVGNEMGLRNEDLNHTVYAALLHDLQNRRTERKKYPHRIPRRRYRD